MAATVNELSFENRHVTEIDRVRETEESVYARVREREGIECQELQIWIANWLKLFIIIIIQLAHKYDDISYVCIFCLYAS